MISDDPFRFTDPRSWSVGVWLWLAVIAAGSIPGLWKRYQRWRTTSWPLTDGRIESVNVTRPSKWFRTSQKATSDVAEIGYSYSLGGSAYGGSYKRRFASSGAAWEFLRDLKGKSITVHYNPGRMSESALSEPSLHTLIQARAPLPEGESANPTFTVPIWVKPFLWAGVIFSAVGFLISLCVHIAALKGQRILPEPFFFAMHAGIFVVWFPTVIVASQLTKGSSKRDFWKAVLKDAPDWMRYLIYGLFAYNAVLEIATFAAHAANKSGNGDPSIADWRGFSGVWMVFYSAAMAVLYSAANYGKSTRSDLQEYGS